MAETSHVHFEDEGLVGAEKNAAPSISCHDLPHKLQECIRSPNDVSKLDWIYPTATRCLSEDLAMLPPLTPSLMFNEAEEELESRDPEENPPADSPVQDLAAPLPDDNQARDELDEALQTSCLFRAQAGRLLVRVEAATPHYGRRLAKMASELIVHAEAADKLAARLLEHLAVADEPIRSPLCLPMPESWTLSAAAKVLRKQGKESLALDLEKLASRASGSAVEKCRLSKFEEQLISARALSGPMRFFGRACSI